MPPKRLQNMHGSSPIAVRAFSALMLIVILLGLAPLKVFADQPLRSHKGTVFVQILTPMDVHSTINNSFFEGVTRENYFFHGSAVPAGTILTGHVHLIKPSRRLARPGFVQLDIEQAKFPSGRLVSLSQNSEGKDQSQLNAGLRTRKLTHQAAIRFPYLLEIGLGLTAGSAVVDIPVKIITGYSAFIILGIGTGVRIIEGIAAEYLPAERRRHNRHSDSWPRRYGHGFLRGVGAIGVYYMFKRSPNPELEKDKMLPIRFEKRGLETLFKAAQEEPLPSTATPIPAN